MITSTDVLMGREKEYPLTEIMEENLLELVHKANIIIQKYGKELKVSSGYRPGKYNEKARGAKLSPHLTCEAIDFHDPDGEFAKWCTNNVSFLSRLNIYMEEPAHTNGWVHLQTRKVKSGRIIFKP